MADKKKPRATHASGPGPARRTAAGPAGGLSETARAAIEAHAAWSAVSTAFAALGRVFICADDGFRIVHASDHLDEVLGREAARAIERRPLEEVFGAALFGPAGALRQALQAGERREGWRAHLFAGGESHLVSLTAAPLPSQRPAGCDPAVSYVIVLRPADQDRGEMLGAPTTLGGLVARSPAMLRIATLVEHLRHTEATVLLLGESGTGKELVARAIHDHSPRRDGPFVAVNCGALPADLLESEMFGHIRGAFTGAVRDRAGRFEVASSGTLFLDEIGDLPLALQVKLLRVLQDGTFERVGESQTRVSRARVVAATNIDLLRAVSEGRFRDDLYFRLRVVPIEIPPLRERPEDIEPIAHAVLARVGARHGRALQFSPEALRALLQHGWPGNVRELENVIEFAVAVCAGQTILPEHLPALSSLGPGAAAAPAAATAFLTAPHRPATGEDTPDAALRRALHAHHWRRGPAAKALGVSRVTLWRRMRAAGLE